MDRRDVELLDKELWGVSPNPSPNAAIIGLIAVAIFFVGIAIGGLFFGHVSKQVQIMSHDAIAAISLPYGG